MAAECSYAEHKIAAVLTVHLSVLSSVTSRYDLETIMTMGSCGF